MHLLMCPPAYFDVAYEINPWMHLDNVPNVDKAKRQWDALYAIITDRIGARVSLIDPQPGLPDMVFTANAGLVEGCVYIPSRFRHAERAGEVPHFERWFQDRQYHRKPLSDGWFEGEGDALSYAGILLAGYGPRSSAAAHPELARILGRDVLSLGLVDGRYYHLDVCFAPLGPNMFAYIPEAFDEAANRALLGLPGEKITLSAEDAQHFGANAVVIGRDIILNTGANSFSAALTERGYHVHETDLSEFLKAGGSAKCLTLILER
ncbi:MAG: N-Dimethylarginine dimethylaminohydrolase [Capsulimonas sp.]|jgi:N-dimethylarginine dimethylaminohydrolase|nr:N-Dimethylarginine dimethylaminohydrolase [Capsulimonas sp.]